jgi:agmatinase
MEVFMHSSKAKPKQRADRAFVGIPSFLRSRICTNIDTLDADIAVVGVPTDEGSPFMAGSRFAPRAIREHSMRFAGRGLYDVRTGRQFLQFEMENDRIADVGDVDILPTNVVETFENITETISAIIDRDVFPVILGGDHSISFPVLRAFKKPLSVVQFDAHLDYTPVGGGLEFTNGHPFRHIRKLPNMKKLIQIGIRSLRNTREQMEDSQRDGNRVVTIDEFQSTPFADLLQYVPSDLPCYVSIDIDVFDMPLVPGCVSAEPNGMNYKELSSALAQLARHTEIIGFDLVEVNPQLDVGTQTTSYLAAHTIIDFLGHICDQPWWSRTRSTRNRDIIP